jgi:glutamate decarboxylase
MPVKRVRPSRDLEVNPLFSREPVRVPRYALPAGEMDPDTAYQVVHDELMLDGNARQNLATFVSTWAEPQALRLMADCAEKNMIDKDEYPQTAELETRCVHMLARLWHAEDPQRAVGCSTTGSSEASMLGGLALKRRWRHRAPGRGRAGRPAQPRHGRQRADLLGEVRRLLRGRTPLRADGR